MLLAAGKIESEVRIDGVPKEVTLFTAEQDTKVTFMQFVSDEPLVDTTLSIFIVFKKGQVRVIPETLIKTNILQFEVNYFLEEIEYIFAIANTDSTINYLINGELM